MSVNPNPNTPATPENEPFIPPNIMLGLAALGIVVAVLVRLSEATFSVVGWGALAFSALSLIAWGVLAPDQVKELAQGRALRFGGVSLLVTLIFLVALGFVYGLVKGFSLHADLTQSADFTLTEDSRDAIRVVANDPNVPPIHIIVFYGSAQAGQRDQDTVLLDDYIAASVPSAGGPAKLSYEFVDPDRNPTMLESYEAQPGQLAVVSTNPDGTYDVQNAEVFSPIDQFTGGDLQTNLTNAILRVAAAGDFRAYFLSVEDGSELEDTGDTGLSTINTNLHDRFNWNTQEVTFAQLTSVQSSIILNDPLADGEVMVIAGGSQPLRDQDLQIITDFVDAGGALVIFADIGIDENGESLATADNMSEWLYAAFGVRLSRDVVLDQSQAIQQPTNPYAIDFANDIFITGTFESEQALVMFQLPHPIEIADTLPTNVSVTELAFSGEQSYLKSVDDVLDNDIPADDNDERGPFVLAVAAENEVTGARLVVIGSSDVPMNLYADARSMGLYDLDMAFNSLVWATDFVNFFTDIESVDPNVTQQDTPIFASAQEIRTINIITLLVLPFGVLAIGVLVWWFNRERQS
jgi:hypothetical protein